MSEDNPPHRSGLVVKRAASWRDDGEYDVFDDAGALVAKLFRSPGDREWYEQELPGQPQTHYTDRWRGSTQSEALDTIVRLRALRHNPPPGWWHRHPDKNQACYPTKSEALARFLDANQEIVENYGGADYAVSPSEFDSVNHKLGLSGSKAVRTIADAVWASMPPGKPYCIDRVDLEALNGTSPAREAGLPFRLPDDVVEAKLVGGETQHYAGSEPVVDDEPDWVNDLSPASDLEPYSGDDVPAPAPATPRRSFASKRKVPAPAPPPARPPQRPVAKPRKAIECFYPGDRVSFLDDTGKRRKGKVVRVSHKQIVVDSGGYEWGIKAEHLERA